MTNPAAVIDASAGTAAAGQTNSGQTNSSRTRSGQPASVPPDVVVAAGELRVALGRITRRLRRPGGQGELTQSELSVLARLDEHGPSGPAALAEIEQVSAPVVCATLASLQRHGMVLRERDRADGRRIVISLTAAGRSALTARRSAVSRRVADALTAEFTPAERQQVLDIIPLLHRLAAQL